jgi:hypothetical protein
MKLLFDTDSIDIELYPGQATDLILKCYKHLQHVSLPIRDWDYPFYIDQVSHNEIIVQLCNFAKQLDIEVDPTQCHQQSYLNQLHQIYEKNYNGKSLWLDFHENIHLCELTTDRRLRKHKYLFIDYRELSGPLTSKFDYTLLDQLKFDINPGVVVIKWSELGKTPYSYWSNKEPNDITRICELVKPFLNFRPKLCIPTHPVSVRENIDAENFNKWWDQYEHDWCKHWNIKSWKLDHMLGQIVIGHVVNFDKFLQILQSKSKLQRVVL